ncbi:unnamed protein product [Rangifer tarandus platyrhynchus]|uniref:Uncharacterized protein n=1 Tax=Rangifer tarandus platyrhynchus TaxID=3082113 RepID=A0AC59Z4F7_RANTA
MTRNSEACLGITTSLCGSLQTSVLFCNQSDHKVHGSPSSLLAPTVEHNGTRFSWSVGSAQPRYSPKELNCTQSLLSSGLVFVSILNSTLDWGWDIQAQDKSRTCLPLATHSHVLPAPCSLQWGRGQKIDEKCPCPALPLESVLSSGPSSDCQSLLLTTVFFEGRNKINSSVDLGRQAMGAVAQMTLEEEDVGVLPTLETNPGSHC